MTVMPGVTALEQAMSDALLCTVSQLLLLGKDHFKGGQFWGRST